MLQEHLFKEALAREKFNSIYASFLECLKFLFENPSLPHNDRVLSSQVKKLQMYIIYFKISRPNI